MQYVRTSEDFGRIMLEEIAKLEKECGIKLSKPQKALLAEIGTVEQLLSIYADSPIHVEVVSSATTAHDAGFYETTREVWLCNQAGRRLVFARTKYNPDKLSSSMRKDLLEGTVGIGTAIRTYKLETYRNIIKLGYDSDECRLYREYTIVWNRIPLFTIREEFSLNLFAD